MIPIEYHQALFNQSRAGMKVDFVIIRVPGSALNVYIGRTGSIRNIRMEHGRIKWLDILIDSFGYGKSKLVNFPVDHIFLTKPLGKRVYTSYATYAKDDVDNITDVVQDPDEYVQDPDEYVQEDNIYDDVDSADYHDY
jgi:hypothetical protein